MFKSYLKYSAEDREWIERARQSVDLTRRGWKPPKGAELSERAVNALTAEAQFGYKADASTRGALPKGWGKPKLAPKRLNAKDALIAELRAEIAGLEALLDERTRPALAAAA